MCLLRQKRVLRTPGGTGVTGDFEPLNKGAGAQTWAPWKSRNHVADLLLLHSLLKDLNFSAVLKLSSFSPGMATLLHSSCRQPYSRAVRR